MFVGLAWSQEAGRGGGGGGSREGEGGGCYTTDPVSYSPLAGRHSHIQAATGQS